HNQSEQRIADLLGRDLAEILPLLPALVMAKLDLVGFNGPKERVELEVPDFIALHANILAPLFKESDPVTECSNSRHFAWHKYLLVAGSKQLVARAQSTKPGVPGRLSGTAHPGCPPPTTIHFFHFPLNVAGRFSTYAANPS